MKKLFYKISVCLLIAFFCLGAAVGCKDKKSAVSNNVKIMNAYEEYNDLVFTSTLKNNVVGKASINTDSKYVTQGKASALYEIDFDQEKGLVDRCYAEFTYYTQYYDEAFSYLDRIRNFAIDIYNADDSVYDVYFEAIGTADETLTSGHRRLYSGWNYCDFDVKPWFYEKDTQLKAYRLTFLGIADNPTRSAKLYFDNVRAIFAGGGTLSQKQPAATGETGEYSILGFDKASDIDYINADNRFGDKQLKSLYGISYASKVPDGETSRGGLKFEFDRVHMDGCIWKRTKGYVMDVHKSLLSGITGAKKISVNCFNPDIKPKTIEIRITENGNAFTYRRTAAALGTTVISTDELSVSNIESLSIAVENWNAVELETLYFDNLRYSV